MHEFQNALQGYTPAILALIFLTAYFALVALIVRRTGPQRVRVPRYQVPPMPLPRLPPGFSNATLRAPWQRHW
jgi:hypothetical protein